jgi:hypothetical protein
MARKRKLGASLKDGGMSGLRELFRGKLDFDAIGKLNKHGKNSRKCLYDPLTTFMLFLLQTLSGLVCDDVVKFFQASQAVNGRKKVSSDSGAYCKARIRLGRRLLPDVFKRLAESLTPGARNTWKEFAVRVVDGTGLTMPDTAENRAAYPPSGEKTRGCSFPQMNIVAIFDLFTGAVLKWEVGNKLWGEQALWKRIMASMAMSGVIFMGDTYYCSYGNIANILDKGGHCVLPKARRMRFKVVKILGKGDRIIHLRKPASRAKSWTKAQWDKFPDFLEVRLIDRSLQRKGHRAEKHRVITTLLDPVAYPADEVFDLQRRRWEAELRLRDLKTVMGMDHLSCQTPEMIRKEVAMHMIVHNLVRSLMADAVSTMEVEPSRLSFARGLGQTAEWFRAFVLTDRSKKVAKRLVHVFLDSLAEDILPFRPGRSEPRVIKRYTQKFPRMRKPRRLYLEHQRVVCF